MKHNESVNLEYYSDGINIISFDFTISLPALFYIFISYFLIYLLLLNYDWNSLLFITSYIIEAKIIKFDLYLVALCVCIVTNITLLVMTNNY